MRLEIWELVNSHRLQDGFWQQQNFEAVKAIEVQDLADAERHVSENQIIYQPCCSAAVAVPMPGDVVLSSSRKFGIIGGMVGQAKSEYLIGFNMASVFRNESVVDPGNGGPFHRIATADLVSSNSSVLYRFWGWKRGRAGYAQGANYWVKVSLWYWNNSAH